MNMQSTMKKTTGSATPSPLSRKFLKDFEYERNHPFYANWNDWRSAVFKYHSSHIIALQHSINKGDRRLPTQLGDEYDYLVDEIYFQTRDLIDHQYAHPYNNLFEDFNHGTVKFQPHWHWNCSCDEEYVNLLNNECPLKLIHLQAHLISYLWAYDYISKPKKSLRKYYNRLERVILSLPYERLQHFSPDLISDPPKYKGRGRFLLKELYERAYFDKNTSSILENTEYLKHFIREQSGTSQCPSASLFPDEILTYAEQLFSKYDVCDIIDSFTLPKQQMFTFQHKIDFSDSNYGKIRDIVKDSQASFMKNLKDTLIDSGKIILVMFCTAATISLLAKLACGVAGNVIFKLLHVIYAMICGPSDAGQIKNYAKAQAGEGSLSIPFLPAMVMNHIICPPKNILNTIWKNPQIDLVMRRIGYLGDPKLSRGLETIIDWMKQLINTTINWFRQDILGLDPLESIDNEVSAIITWNEEVDKIVQSYYDGAFSWTDSTWSILMNLYSRGLTFTRQAAFAKYKQDVWKLVTKIGNILEKFKTHARSGTTIRNPPVTIYLSGGTGVGKSSITYPLAAEILKEIFTEEDSPLDLKQYWKSLIYMRSAEQEYWDGYENQLVTVFDDFNQQTDSAANPNLELFEIIRSANCFPYPLHMAAIEQKANTMFTSKIILVSSNMEKPKTQSLNFPTALERRFDLCIRVSRKPSCTGRLTSFDPDIYELEQYDMVTGETIGPITYNEVILKASQEYFSRKNFVNSVDDYITDVLNKPPRQQGGLTDIFNNTTEKAMGIISGRALSHGLPPPLSTTEKALHETVRYTRGTIGSALLYVAAKREEFNSWYYDDPFSSLKSTIMLFKRRYSEIQTAWTTWKANHPWLYRTGITLAAITTGLIFLKMFFSIRQAIAPEAQQKQKLMSPESFCGQQEADIDNMTTPATPEAYNPAQPKVAKREAYGQPAIKVAKRESELPKPQAVKDVNAAEMMMSLVRKNLYRITESTGNTPIGHVLFIKGKVCLMPRHYMTAFKQSLKNDPNATVHFEAVLLRRAFEIHISDLLSEKRDYQSPAEESGPVYTRDLMTMAVKSAIHHADVTSFFVKKNEMSRVDITSVMLPVLLKNMTKESDRAILLLRFAEGRSQLQRVSQLPIGNDDDVVVRFIRDAWQYNLDTKPTECGAPLIVRNVNITPGKVCGIHIAGLEGTGQGFSTPLYKEDVEQILSLYPEYEQFTPVIRTPLELPHEQGTTQIPDEAEFIRMGKLQKPLAQPVVTKVRPSLCHALIQTPTTKPCALRPVKVNGETFDPRAYRLGRLGNVPEAIRQDIIENSKRALVDEISQVICAAKDSYSSSVKAVYSFEEAVVGIPGEAYLNSIKRDTSPGFPFVQMPGYHSRKEFFGENDIYDLTNPKCAFLKQRCENIIAQAKKGNILDHIFIDTLKDERKTIEKAHKTRLFSAGPLDYLIVCKQYFSGIVALIQKNRNWSHISVGTNPYSEDWGEVARTLLRKSEHMVAGDFEGFDASQHQNMLQAAGEVLIILSQRLLKATVEDCKIMRVLLASLFNSIHATGDDVYQWTHSLASGHYLTAVINSIFVNISFVSIWQICFDKYTYLHARSFYDECGLVAYGDDHILSIPEQRLTVFNQITLPLLFKKIGLSYTMEDKDAVAKEPSRKLAQVSYLKRSFIEETNRRTWLAPLQLNTILETPMWMHKCPDERAQTVENLDWALKELSLHETGTWATWAPILKREQERLNYYTPLQEQEEVRNVTLSQSIDM